MTDNSYEAFLAALGARESSDDYTEENEYGYLGRYQMGEAALVDAGYVSLDADPYDNDFTGGWTGKNGITSKTEFLDDPLAQEDAIRIYHQKMFDGIIHFGLDEYFGQTIGGIVITASGVLAAAHLKGIGSTLNPGIKQFLESGGTIDPTDANGTPVSEYLENFGGPSSPYDANPIPRNKPPVPDGFTPAPLPEDRLVCPWVDGALDDFENGEATASPLVLDLDGDGIELVAMNGTGSVYWDIDLDGFAEASGWITGGDGLLAVDLNADGFINNHSELFGNQTGSPNGFAALAAYDSNSSGTITSADSDFGDLLVWVDTNADGYSQSGELHTLSSLGITSINLSYSNVNYAITGNTIKQSSTFTMAGNTRTIVDAWFAYDNVNTVYAQDCTLDVRTLFLPTLRGYGNLPDLHIAMSLDGDLLDLVTALATDGLNLSALPFDPYSGPIRDIMFKWAGVENVNPTSRGVYIDARVLGFLEVLVGDDFSQGGQANPLIAGAPFLWDAWEKAYEAIMYRLVYQIEDAGKIFDGGAPYNPSSDTFGTASSLNIDEIEDRIMASNGWADGIILSKFIISTIDEIMGVNNLSTQDYDDLEALLPTGLTIEMVTQAISGLNTVYGDSLDNLIIGDADLHTANNDYIYGYGGNDILIGGRYVDYLYGGAGNDTYVFNLGDGLTNNPDQVNESLSDGTDTISFGAGIEVEDVYLWTDYTGKLFIKYGGADDVISVAGGVAGSPTHYATTVGSYVEQIVFADTTTWDLTAGLHLRNDNTSRALWGTNYVDTIDGGTASDTLYGYNGNDVLTGGGGLDYMYGGAGNDTYVFNIGNGLANNPDQVIESLSEGTDTISFGASIDVEDVYLWTDYTGKLFIKYGGTDDVISIAGGVAGSPTHYANTVGSYVEQIVFADTTTWDLTAGLHLRNDNTSRALWGTNYADTIEGGSSSDTLYGYNGDDFLYGGAGTDSLNGGAGADTFTWRTADLASVPLDTIDDFSKAGGDKIDLSDVLFDAGYDPLTDLISSFVRFSEGASNTTLYVDVTGTGTFSAANDIATLTGVTDILGGGSGSNSTEMDLQTLISNGLLIAA